jgi:uncharacterized protein YkwD
VVQTVVAPEGPAAAQYGGPLPYTLQGTEQAISDALADLPVRHLPALSKMTRELARTAPDRVNIPPALVDGLMSWAGLVDPPPRLVIIELPEDPAQCDQRPTAECQPAIGSLVAQVSSTLPESDHVVYGVGVVKVSPTATRMIVAVLERTVALEPLRSSVPKGGSVEIRGRLLGGRSGPMVEVIDPKGVWTQQTLSAGADGSFRTTVTCGKTAGPHQIEVLAEGEHGPEVAANFPLYCGTPVPQRMHVEIERIDADVSAQQLAWANFAHLNEERERRGLEPLEWDDDAARVAIAHSLDMQQNGFVGHRSPTTGDVRARFDRAKLRGSVIRENVARGYGPKGMHDSLMGSPGHRINLVADDVTHVGIGIVIGAPETSVAGAPRPLFCTQNFFRKPGAGAPAAKDWVPTLRSAVDRKRKADKLAPVGWDAELSRMAERLAKTYARGHQPKKGFEQELFGLGYQSVATHQVRSADFDALAGIDLWKERELFAGIGIVRVADDTFLMVILVGER